MAEDIKTKIKNYKTAPFDSRFPNQNQTKNCWQNYLGKKCTEWRVADAGLPCTPTHPRGSDSPCPALWAEWGIQLCFLQIDLFV